MFKQSKYPEIKLTGCQIKSMEKAKLLCGLLDTMEKEFGIGSVYITIKNCFICPDIDLMELYESTMPMERLVGGLLIELDVKLYGKESRYVEVKRPDKKGS